MKGEKTMSKKVKNEVYYNVSELMEKLCLDEEIVLHSIKTGVLKEEHWVSEQTLNVYLEGQFLHLSIISPLIPKRYNKLHF